MDVKAIFRRHGINILESGKNVRKGCFAIHCPLCGSSDPSQHCNVQLNGKGFQCWRNKSHKGSLKYLLTILVGAAAANEALEEIADETFDDFDKMVAQLYEEDKPKAEIPAKHLEWPMGSRKIRNAAPTTAFWKHFVTKRGFREEDVDEVCDRYDLRCAVHGEWNGRYILPVFSWDGYLIAWTGRALGKSTLRYKAFPKDGTIKTSLFGLPEAQRGGERLLIVEGPFDQLKTDFYASKKCHSVGVMSTSIKAGQKSMLFRLARLYTEVCIALDEFALEQALSLQSELSFLKPRVLTIPEHFKVGLPADEEMDPGMFTPEQVQEIFAQ